MLFNLFVTSSTDIAALQMVDSIQYETIAKF